MGVGHGLGHSHCSCQGGEKLASLFCDSHMALHPGSAATATRCREWGWGDRFANPRFTCAHLSQ